MAVEAVFHLGYSHYMLRNYRKAREYFNRVLALAPGTELSAKSQEFLKKLG